MSIKTRLSTKIWALVIFCLFALCVLGLITNRILDNLQSEIKMQSNKLVPGTRAAGLIDMYHDGIRAVVYGSVIAGNRGTDQNEFRKEFEEMKDDLLKTVVMLNTLNIDPLLVTEMDRAMPAIEDYFVVSSHIINLAAKGDSAAVQAALPDFNAKFENLAVVLDKLGEHFEAVAETLASGAIGASETGKTIELWAVILTCLVAIIFSWVLIRSIVSGIKRTINDINTSAKTLRTIGKDLEKSASELAQATTEQASAIEESVASMEEMTAMIAQTSSNASTSADIAEKGVEEAKNGNDIADRLVEAMNEIENANRRLERIVTLITEIESKTKVINDIVFETRLLSFNASIEASRAGEHGKGFSVVAEEVGKLAAMSGKAADEIRVLLESSTREVADVVKTTQGKVELGHRVSMQSCEAFRTIDQTLRTIGTSVNAINVAAKEQEIGVKQTNQAMNEMDTTTQMNSKSAEHLASCSKQITGLISELDKSVKVVTALVDGEQKAA